MTSLWIATDLVLVFVALAFMGAAIRHMAQILQKMLYRLDRIEKQTNFTGKK